MSAADGELAAGVEQLDLRDPRYPTPLARTPDAPSVLYVAGGADRLHALLSQPVVAILGTRAASDYGVETARGLARGLAASGVVVLSALAEGIACAAHSGALEVDGPTVTVMPGGLDVCYPAACADLYRRVRERGCAISEQPRGTQASRWCLLARARIVAGIARLLIVVEATDHPRALEPAAIALANGRTVAAVPGRVSSPVSRGPHALLIAGAQLVRDAQDVLDLLFRVDGGERPPAHAPHDARARHRPRRAQAHGQTPPRPGGHAQAPPSTPSAHLQAVLDLIGAGEDTLAKLTARGADEGQTQLALAELELRGALVRGDGGRYMPRA